MLATVLTGQTASGARMCRVSWRLSSPVAPWAGAAARRAHARVRRCRILKLTSVVDQVFSRTLRVHMHHYAICGLTLAAVARRRIAVVQMRITLGGSADGAAR